MTYELGIGGDSLHRTQLHETSVYFQANQAMDVLLAFCCSSIFSHLFISLDNTWDTSPYDLGPWVYICQDLFPSRNNILYCTQDQAII